MPAKQLLLVKQATHKPQVTSELAVFDAQEARHWLKPRALPSHLFRYTTVQGYTYHHHLLTKPFGFALFLRLLSRGSCDIVDQQGHKAPVTLGYLARLGRYWLRDRRQAKPLVKQAMAEIKPLQQPANSPPVTLTLSARPVYLRTDLNFGLQSGGSVGHVAGVLNHLDVFSGAPLLIATDRMPTIRPDIEMMTVWPDDQFRELPDLRPLSYSNLFYTAAQQRLQGGQWSFLYQRYSVNNYAGLRLARTLRLPFILEFNGPEVWVHRHWGNPLSHEALAEEIELTNLRGAQVVVVVSQVLKDELVARGIEAAKILVNPNGVDPERYSPAIDGTAIRQRYGLANHVVIGFIGTFGPWHGAELLAEAYGRLLQQHPAYRERTRLLLIGDGIKMPEVKANLAKYGATDYAILTGLVPQAQGPSYLAACDLLVSPHVPNADGTPFFGSPTKLFEYMAMGKAIVASDLDQIGDILAHDETAWLVQPGDVDALTVGLRQLIDDGGRRLRLGEAARQEVVAKYTWRAHTQRIIEALQQRILVNHA